MAIFGFLAFVFGLMGLEASLSARNERRLRGRGAVEPPGDVIPAMQVAYPAGFLVIGLEGLMRGGPDPRWWLPGLTVFVLAKMLKYSAIAALRDRWCFRILVPPGEPLVTRGPYRILRHPNYLAIAGEFSGAALACAAVWSGPCVVLGFGWLMRRRIVLEDRWLRGAAGPGIR